MIKDGCLMCKHVSDSGICECELSDFYEEYVDIRFMCSKYEKI